MRIATARTAGLPRKLPWKSDERPANAQLLTRAPLEAVIRWTEGSGRDESSLRINPKHIEALRLGDERPTYAWSSAEDAWVLVHVVRA